MELTPHPGLRVRALRRGRNLRQADLAARSGISQQRISQIETGEARLWPGYRARLATALGIAPDDLL